MPTSLTGGLGQQSYITRDAQGNIVRKDPTNKFVVGMGAPYSSGTGGQIVTPESMALKDQQYSQMQLRYGDLGAMTREAMANRARPGSPVAQYLAQTPQGVASSAGGSSSRSSLGGGSGGTSAPQWGRRFLDDQLARIRQQAALNKSIGEDKLAAEGWTDRSGLHQSEDQAVLEAQLAAERGAAADDERLRQEWEMRMMEAAARQQAKAEEENRDFYRSLSDAAVRLEARRDALGGGGEGGSAPLSGGTFGASFNSQDRATLASRIAENQIPDLRTVSREQLTDLMVDGNKRQRYGFTYNQVKQMYDARFGNPAMAAFNLSEIPQ